jgi:hypothetical protein
MTDAEHPFPPPLPPPPSDDAHHAHVDRVFPELSPDQPVIIQFPGYADRPRPRVRGTETGQEG